MQEHEKIKVDEVKPDSLTSKDIQDEVMKTGKSVVRTTLVWTFASLATGFLRDIIKSKMGKK